jgi:hypothetical protein
MMKNVEKIETETIKLTPKTKNIPPKPVQTVFFVRKALEKQAKSLECEEIDLKTELKTEKAQL